MGRPAQFGGPLVLALFALLVGANGARADDASDKKSDGRFTGIAIVTSNLDWFDMFNRPEPPAIKGVGHLGAGERGSLALIFSNAEPRDGKIKIECDVTAFDPKGSSPVVQSGSCYEGPYLGDDVLHPALLDLRFGVGETDPVGRAGFNVTLRDTNSGRNVDLTVSFQQGGAP